MLHTLNISIFHTMLHIKHTLSAFYICIPYSMLPRSLSLVVSPYFALSPFLSFLAPLCRAKKILLIWWVYFNFPWPLFHPYYQFRWSLWPFPLVLEGRPFLNSFTFITKRIEVFQDEMKWIRFNKNGRNEWNEAQNASFSGTDRAFFLHGDDFSMPTCKLTTVLCSNSRNFCISISENVNVFSWRHCMCVSYRYRSNFYSQKWVIPFNFQKKRNKILQFEKKKT